MPIASPEAWAQLNKISTDAAAAANGSQEENWKIHGLTPQKVSDRSHSPTMGLNSEFLKRRNFLRARNKRPFSQDTL